MLEGTKRGINEYRLRDNAPIIHELFDELDNFLKRKDDDELPHQLLNPIISEIWVRLISFIAEICSMPEKSIDCKEKCPRATYLGLVFEIRSIFQRLQDLTKKYDDGFIRMARLYGRHYDYDSRDLISKLIRCGFYDDSDNVLNDARENFVFLEEKIKETKYNLKPIYYNINSDIQSYASYAWCLLEDVIPSDREIQDDVEIAFNEYCKKFRNDAMRKLKQEVQQYKPYRGAQLTTEVWGEALRAEDDVLDLAIKGGGALVQSTDKRFEYYGEDMRQLMENNYNLLQKIKDVSLDEQLFDLKYAAEPHINLYDKLTAENLDIFLDLILRRNLIQCEMYPNLKDEFETWLRQVLTEENESAGGRQSFIHTYDISILPDRQRHLFMKPDKFDAYCRVLNGNIKTFIEGQGSKALWDVVNFYSMLYGFFPKNISRENAAGIFMSIVPELKAEKPLSMMRKCNFTDKKKLKNYATLPATDGLKAYEENIGKWIKEIAQSEESSQ